MQFFVSCNKMSHFAYLTNAKTEKPFDFSKRTIQPPPNFILQLEMSTKELWVTKTKS